MLDENLDSLGNESAITCMTHFYEPWKASVEEYNYAAGFDNPGTASSAFEQYLLDQTSWMVAEGEEYYYADIGEQLPADNELQNCLAMTEFNASDAPDFGYYSVIFGARHVAADGTETDFIKGEDLIEFRPPNADIAVKEVQIQGSETNDATVTVENVDYEITQDFFVGYEITQDFDTPNQMGMMFELDIPSKLIPERAVIYQYAQYRKTENYAGEWVTVACKNQVGSRDSQEVFNFRGKQKFTGLDSATGDMLTYKDQHFSDFVEKNPRDGTEFFKIRVDDDESY